MKKINFFVVAMAILLAVPQLANAQETHVFNFDELTMPDTGFWCGSDTSVYNHFYGDDEISFPNNYNFDWLSWDNFSFSNWTNTTSQEYSNQWSVNTGEASSGTNFGLAYIPIDWNDSHYPTTPIDVEFTNPVKIESLQITNSTFTALTIENGDDYCTAFSDGDYYKIFIYGVKNDVITDTVEVYLADFQNGNSYIASEWINVDLTSLDSITELRFDAYSTDIGDFGINTPLYFCLDDISYSTTPTSNDEIQDLAFNVYPNPAIDYITIEGEISIVNIFDLTGRIVKTSKTNTIDVSDLTFGTYILQTKTDNIIKTAKFVKL